MPLNRPCGTELLAAVRQWVQTVAQPANNETRAYEARIAANLLDILERELTLGERFAAGERSGLAALLGRDGPLDELNFELSERIRRREIGIGNAPLLAHLRRSAIAKLEIENPRYSAYRRARRA